jgi:hypothetical protein
MYTMHGQNGELMDLNSIKVVTYKTRFEFEVDFEYLNMPMLSILSPKNPLQRTTIDLIVHKVHN